MKDLHDLFIYELETIYNAEKQIIKAMPNIAESVSSTKLKGAIKDHLRETEKQIERLEAIFLELGKSASGMTSKSMESLLKEADKIIQSDFEPDVKEAALINCLQHIEHFEIASYGTLKSLAKKFKYDRVHELLEESSKEEGRADKKLTEVAEGTFFSKGINEKARRRAA